SSAALPSFPTRRSSDLEPQQYREQAFIEMAGARARKFADKRWFRSIETAQQFVQRAQHLFGERGRDGGLRLTTFAQQRRQAAVRSEEHTSELQSLRHRV